MATAKKAARKGAAKTRQARKPKAAKKAAKKASAGGTIRAYVEERLLKTSDPYNKIVGDTLKNFEGAKTSQSSVRWYASRLRAAGKTVPEREVSNEVVVAQT